jgi:hypothetical protein
MIFFHSLEQFIQPQLKVRLHTITYFNLFSVHVLSHYLNRLMFKYCYFIFHILLQGHILYKVQFRF